jgi:hypothetical protein
MMTLVNKGSGPKGGRPKLVCTKAKAGAGCPYHAVDYGPIERALVSQAARLVGEAPRDGAAEEHADALQVATWAKEDELQHLVDAVASGGLPNTPTLAARIKQAETELSDLRRELTAAMSQAAASRGPLVAGRLADLDAVLSAEPLDRPRANALLRQLLASVTVNWPDWALGFKWHHGGESELAYGMPPAA